MPKAELRELSKAVNAEARRRHPALMKQLGRNGLAATRWPRLTLRAETPYPYHFHEDDSFYPSKQPSFGRAIYASREEGLQAIHEQIAGRRLEHQWLHIGGANLWVDVTNEASETAVASDEYAQVFLSYLFPQLSSVHIHPDQVVRQLAINNTLDFSENYLLEAALPSPGDFMRHVMMIKRSAPNSQLTEQVVSHYGVTSFTTVEAGESTGYYQSHSYTRLIEQADEPIAAIRDALGALSTRLLLYDDVTPAFDFAFQPLT